MTDRKGYAVHNDHRTVDAERLFHDMTLRVTVDDTLLIHSIDACIDAGPHRICPAVTPNFQGRPAQIDTCHALSDTGEVVEKYLATVPSSAGIGKQLSANLGRNIDFYPGCGPS
jgi:Protein of unknown function (DUF2889)